MRELDDELGLCGASELGIDDLIAVRPECRWAWYPAEEVGEPDDGSISKCGLIDGVDSRTQRVQRCSDLIVQVARQLGDVYERSVLRADSLRVVSFVREPIFLNQLGRIVIDSF